MCPLFLTNFLFEVWGEDDELEETEQPESIEVVTQERINYVSHKSEEPAVEREFVVIENYDEDVEYIELEPEQEEPVIIKVTETTYENTQDESDYLVDTVNVQEKHPRTVEGYHEIPTLSTDPNRVNERSIPTIPTMPRAAADTLPPNVIGMPFTPANNDAGGDSLPMDEPVSSFKQAVENANSLPVAPMIPISADNADGGSTEQSEAAQPTDTPAENNSTVTEPVTNEPQEIVVVVNEEVKTVYSGDPVVDEESNVIHIEPEVKMITEQEPILIDEPIEDQPEEPVEEPAQDSADEPIFANAEQADALLTDEEAEAKIEMVDGPGGQSTGKMFSINLDTICEAYENGEKVTLDYLKAQKLVP